MADLNSYLLRCVLTLILFQLHRSDSAGFDVVAPQEPIVALVGEDIKLPCHLSTSMSAEHMELRWFRKTSSQAVLLYRDGAEQEGEQMPEYRGRVSLVKDNITAGHVTVKIHGVKASDEGTYGCSFRAQRVSKEAFLHLEVTALGSDPHISMEVQAGGRVHLKCSSSGWYPKPQVQWRTPKGEVFPSTSKSSSPDKEGLYTVTASLAIRHIFLKSVYCHIQNDHFGLEKKATGSSLPIQIALIVIGICLTVIGIRLMVIKKWIWNLLQHLCFGLWLVMSGIGIIVTGIWMELLALLTPLIYSLFVTFLVLPVYKYILIFEDE